jgi:hypothetical protein
MSSTDYLDALEYRYDADNNIIPPNKFKLIARVGRGGRLILDRFPVRLHLRHSVVFMSY